MGIAQRYAAAAAAGDPKTINREKKSNKCKLVPIRAECNNGVDKYNIILYRYLYYNILYAID